MGEAKSRRSRFFTEHPWCCFCGGNAPAVEEDHQPGRVFFRERKWPEGFSFPACKACNRISRDAENLVSLLVADTALSSDRAAYRRRIASIRINYPGVIPALFEISANEKRKAAKRMFTQKPAGMAYAQLPLVRLDRRFWYPHLEMLGRKLMLAFHYQAFGTPLSGKGRLWLNVQTNADDLQSGWFKFLAETTGRYVFPVRTSKPLLDQMTLQWDAMSDRNVALFLLTLQKRLVFSGLTTEHPDLHDFPNGSVFQPFAHELCLSSLTVNSRRA